MKDINQGGNDSEPLHKPTKIDISKGEEPFYRRTPPSQPMPKPNPPVQPNPPKK